MTILESFDGSSRKPKKMNATKKIPRKTKIALKYTARTENHGHKKVFYSLVLSEFFAALTSIISKPFQCPLPTALPPSKVLRVESPLLEAPPPPPKPLLLLDLSPLTSD